MSARRLVAPLLLAAALLPAAQAHAQVMVVTSPNGASNASDAFPGFYSWFRDDVRAGSSVGITTDFARSGTGSMLLTGDGTDSKADVALYFSPSAYFFTRLSNFAGLSYDSLGLRGQPVADAARFAAPEPAVAFAGTGAGGAS